MSVALRRYSMRQVTARPARTLLTLFSIILGVAAIAAVEMLAVSIQGASEQMFATVAGRASLVVQSPGDAPLDQALLERIDAVEGVRGAAPVIQRAVTLFTGGEDGPADRTRGIIMGVDPQRDGVIRDHILMAGRFVDSGDEVVLEEGFAKSRGVNVGDEIRVLGGGFRPRPMEVVGLVRSVSYAQAATGGMAFIPLSTAQQIFLRGRGQVTSIQILTEGHANDDQVAARIREILPEGLLVEPPALRAAVVEQTLVPMERGLEVSVVFIALLAAFILFNTFMMNVSERRRQMAIVRAVGGTRKQLFGILLSEGLVLGVIGTALGIVAGWQGAIYVTEQLTGALEVDIPQAVLTTRILLEAVAFGIVISLVGVLYPAWRAARLTPLEAMSPLSKDDIEHTSIWPVIIGTTIVGLGGIMLTLTMNNVLPITWGVYAAIAILLGLVVLAETVLLLPVSTIVSHGIRPWFGVTASLAHRQVVRHKTRSALTSGVIFIAAAAGLALSWVILDMVNNVRSWVETAIDGDFYVRVALPDFATGESPETPAEFDERIMQVRHIDSIDRARIVKSRINDFETMVGAREYPTDDHLNFAMVDFEGGRPEIRAALMRGEVFVSSVVAAQANIQAGEMATLETPFGPQEVRVAGITNEYIAGGLLVWMHRDTAERLLGITGYDGYIVYAEDGHRDDVRRQLEPLVQEYGLILQSFTDIRRTVEGIINASDTMLWVLVVVFFLVATFGLINTLAMSVLEQTRELGMLRIVAMTRDQVRKTIVAQATIIAVMGIVPGVLAGTVIGYLMNIAMYTTLARQVAFNFHPLLIGMVSFGFLVLVIVAALIPAYRASRLNVLEALHYE
jgi:putative ABC transport system permease protein